ncbi:uncharacterized protein LOC132628108 isoform X1 [Lycium barbarum]|uniref:uncharacterized protein LOC132628108 isoform X1 n=1 Tax=Lycium barbarum TaxID=112863 RepID=UPI00293E8CE3|nr:uncharacterized protein LOC132628108 isoform X1 [Lycium barbarum]
MESALLSASRFTTTLHTEREVVGGPVAVRKLQSSFYGKEINNSHALFTRNFKRIPLTVTSVMRRKLVKKETVVPDPDYRIPIVLLGLSGGLFYVENLPAAVPIGLLGLLLLFQTTRVGFVFDDEALEVKVGERLEESGENVFVGGKNRWKYSTFVNWELWWPNFPILVYFKEKQTKPEGQIHFFPVIFNGKQLYDAMVERCGPSKTSGPK